MEPPYKRQRLSASKNLDPDLKVRRAKNDSRLKSIFESIFDKYSKNFEGVGDEIDLRTGEIVVNNGHLLSIRNETDIGQTVGLSGTLDSELSSDEEEGSGIRATAGDGFAISHSDTALQALWLADSLVQDAGAQSPPATFGESLLGQVHDYKCEEDELADKTITWVTPREARAVSHRKWQLPQSGPTFMEESITEEAWRAPPLPTVTPSQDSCHRTAFVNGGSSPADKASPSVWALLREKRLATKKAEPVRQIAEALPHAEPEVNVADTACFNRQDKPIAETVAQTKSLMNTPDNVCSTRQDRGRVRWTQEEEDRLRHLKTATNLSNKEMEGLFADRNSPAIQRKWHKLVHRDNSLPKSARGRRRRVFSVPVLTKSPKDKHGQQQHRDQERQDYSAEAQLSNHKKAARPLDSAVQITNDFFSELGGLLDNSVDGTAFIQSPNVGSSSSSTINGPSAELQHEGLPPNSSREEHLAQTRFNLPPTSSSHQHTERSRSSVESQPGAPQRDLNGCQTQSTVPGLSGEIRKSSDDVIRRRGKVIENLAARGIEVIEPGSTSQVDESEPPSPRDKPVVNVTGEPAFDPKPLKTRPQIFETLSAPYPINGCCEASTNKEDKGPWPQATADKSHEQIPSISVIRRSARVPKQKRMVTPAALKKKQNIQVIVAESKPRKSPKLAERPMTDLRVETDMDTTCVPTAFQQSTVPAASSQPREDFIRPLERSGSKSISLPSEIPDSQPASSSPPAAKDQDISCACHVQQPQGRLPPAPILPSRNRGRQAATDNTINPELIDELSTFSPLPKKRPHNPASPSFSNTQSPGYLTPLTHRAIRGSKRKLAGTQIADSFPPGITDLCDCSEDELSFM